MTALHACSRTRCISAGTTAARPLRRCLAGVGRDLDAWTQVLAPALRAACSSPAAGQPGRWSRSPKSMHVCIAASISSRWNGTSPNQTMSGRRRSCTRRAGQKLASCSGLAGGRTPAASCRAPRACGWPRAGALVQVVHVLRDQRQLVAAALQRAGCLGERDVRGVWFDLGELRASRLVEAPDQRRVREPRFGRRDVLGPVPLPESASVAERLHPGVGGDAGAGHHDDVSGHACSCSKRRVRGGIRAARVWSARSGVRKTAGAALPSSPWIASGARMATIRAVCVYCGSQDGRDASHAAAGARDGRRAGRPRHAAGLRRRHVGMMGADRRPSAGARRGGLRRHPEGPDARRGRARGLDRAARHRGHARAQGLDGGVERRVRHAARRPRHAGGDLRDVDLAAAALPRKPVGLLNVGGYYDGLLGWITRSPKATRARHTARCSTSTRTQADYSIGLRAKPRSESGRAA